MTILLVRHGETALNAQRVLQPGDTPLNERGLAQAQAVAQRLAALPVRGILASDMTRAAQTAAAIAQACALPVRHSTHWHERHFGALRGLAYDTLPGNVIEMEEAPPGGESMDDVRRRARLGWQEALAMQAEVQGLLVVVSHGALLRALLMLLPGPPPGVHAGLRLHNTSVTTVQAQPPHALLQLNCIAHLGEEAGTGQNLLVGG